jgi:hypothetical protein
MKTKNRIFYPMTVLLCGLVVSLASPAGRAGALTVDEQKVHADIESFQDKIRGTVSDSSRVDKLVNLSVNLESLMIRIDEQQAAAAGQIQALIRDYGATRQDFDRLLARQHSKRLALRNELLEIHYQLTNLTSEEEWNKLLKSKQNVLSLAAPLKGE